jgi:RimJ/RimL family protein N-acetyltransferase
MVAADAEPHVAGEDAEMIRWLNGGRSTVEGVRRYVDETRRSWAAGGPHLAFALRTVDGDELAGTTDVRLAEPYLRPGQANLSYGLYPAFRGRGLVSRAVRLMVGWLWERDDVDQIVIRADPANPASAAVARRCGFAYRHRTDDEHGVLDWYTVDR